MLVLFYRLIINKSITGGKNDRPGQHLSCIETDFSNNNFCSFIFWVSMYQWLVEKMVPVVVLYSKAPEMGEQTTLIFIIFIILVFLAIIAKSIIMGIYKGIRDGLKERKIKNLSGKI